MVVALHIPFLIFPPVWQVIGRQYSFQCLPPQLVELFCRLILEYYYFVYFS